MDEMFARLASVDWAAVGVFWIIVLAFGPLAYCGAAMIMDWMDRH